MATKQTTEKETPISDGQTKQVRRLLEDSTDAGMKAYLELEPTLDEAQALIERGDEFKAGMLDLMKKLSITNQYADEETPSKYGYLSGYKKPKPIGEQIARLKELFPGLGDAHSDTVTRVRSGALAVPENCEGYFAIPNLKTAGKLFGLTYGQAVQTVLDTIKQTRGSLYNWREGKLGPKYLRQSDKLARILDELSEAQGNADILIIPAQFGILFAGNSVRRSREKMRGGMFGLGAFQIGIMLLTHPERLLNVDDLWIDCAGDEYSDGGDGVFGYAPLFLFSDGRVEFDASDVSYVSDCYGSSSASVPQ